MRLKVRDKPGHLTLLFASDKTWNLLCIESQKLPTTNFAGGRLRQAGSKPLQRGLGFNQLASR